MVSCRVMADDPQRSPPPGGGGQPPQAVDPSTSPKKEGATAIFSMKVESWMSDIAADFSTAPSEGGPYSPESSDPFAAKLGAPPGPPPPGTASAATPLQP